jgi:hypothetical protein
VFVQVEAVRARHRWEGASLLNNNKDSTATTLDTTPVLLVAMPIFHARQSKKKNGKNLVSLSLSLFSPQFSFVELTVKNSKSGRFESCYTGGIDEFGCTGGGGNKK